MKKKIPLVFVFLLAVFINGCSLKNNTKSTSHTIVFKTPVMKFYDRGFITKYNNHIKLEIYNAGHVVLYLDIYKNRICQSTFECMQAKEFNLKYLHNSYKEDFLYNLFSQSKIYHKDKKNNILIKVK